MTRLSTLSGLSGMNKAQYEKWLKKSSEKEFIRNLEEIATTSGNILRNLRGLNPKLFEEEQEPDQSSVPPLLLATDQDFSQPLGSLTDFRDGLQMDHGKTRKVFDSFINEFPTTQ